MTARIRELVREVAHRLEPQLIAVRRDLHAHPEVSFAERRSTAVVADVLRDAGLPFVSPDNPGPGVSLEGGDVMPVGGGVVLLTLAVRELLSSSEAERSPDGDVGIVPIGVPLIMGPAALTTILLLHDAYGWAWTAVSLGANLLVVGRPIVEADDPPAAARAILKDMR